MPNHQWAGAKYHFRDSFNERLMFPSETKIVEKIHCATFLVLSYPSPLNLRSWCACRSARKGHSASHIFDVLLIRRVEDLRRIFHDDLNDWGRTRTSLQVERLTLVLTRMLFSDLQGQDSRKCTHKELMIEYLEDIQHTISMSNDPLSKAMIPAVLNGSNNRLSFFQVM